MNADWRKVIEGPGGECPHCGRWGKIYSRTINRTMARAAIWLSTHEDWVMVPDGPQWLVRSNQLPTLRWWGLVERDNDAPLREDQKHSGRWRLTPKGREFVAGVTSVPKRVFTYNGEPVRWEGPEVFIHECFKKLFDYEETMKRRYDEEC